MCPLGRELEHVIRLRSRIEMLANEHKRPVETHDKPYCSDALQSNE